MIYIQHIYDNISIQYNIYTLQYNKSKPPYPSGVEVDRHAKILDSKNRFLRRRICFSVIIGKIQKILNMFLVGEFEKYEHVPLTNQEYVIYLTTERGSVSMPMTAEEAIALYNSPEMVGIRKRRHYSRASRTRIENYKIRKQKVIKALRHRVVVTMAKGITTKSGIAKKLQVSPQIVKSVIEERSFDKHLTQFQKSVLWEAKAKLQEVASEMSDRLIGVARNDKKPTNRIQYEAIKDILDRTGVKPFETKETMARQFSPEELQSMLTTTRELEEISKRISKDKSPFLLEKANNSTETGTSDPRPPAISPG